MTVNGNHIIADSGKVFRRISDGDIIGHEIWLGYTYYLGGEPLPEPLLELPEHFEEIDAPDDTPVILPEDAGDDDPIELPDDEPVDQPDDPGGPDDPDGSDDALPAPITAGDIRRMQRRLTELTDVAEHLVKMIYENN